MEKKVKKNKETNKNKNNQKTESFTHIKAHEARSFDGLSQEQDVRNLNENGFLFKAICNACENSGKQK